MATKSIQKSITVKTNDACRKLIHALGNAHKMPHRDVQISKKNTIVTDQDEIRKMFGKD